MSFKLERVPGSSYLNPPCWSHNLISHLSQSLDTNFPSWWLLALLPLICLLVEWFSNDFVSNRFPLLQMKVCKGYLCIPDKNRATEGTRDPRGDLPIPHGWIWGTYFRSCHLYPLPFTRSFPSMLYLDPWWPLQWCIAGMRDAQTSWHVPYSNMLSSLIMPAWLQCSY